MMQLAHADIAVSNPSTADDEPRFPARFAFVFGTDYLRDLALEKAIAPGSPLMQSALTAELLGHPMHRLCPS